MSARIITTTWPEPIGSSLRGAESNMIERIHDGMPMSKAVAIYWSCFESCVRKFPEIRKDAKLVYGNAVSVVAMMLRAGVSGNGGTEISKRAANLICEKAIPD